MGYTSKSSRRISDPLKRLTADVQQISEGNLDSRTEVVTDDEIGTLAIHNFWVTSDAEYAAGYLTLENGTEIYVYLMRP